ncbi:hypothetical protein AGLY_016116 [Aphis glycines]|uniref:Uncharacterized protein n=1 Tax=Aphis glycines TaxID=307491 RepID=A0A6G0T032_APHGL|nr:hypothetical protein AGLY_016116 [Aphis glycines]
MQRYKAEPVQDQHVKLKKILRTSSNSKLAGRLFLNTNLSTDKLGGTGAAYFKSGLCQAPPRTSLRTCQSDSNSNDVTSSLSVFSKASFMELQKKQWLNLCICSESGPLTWCPNGFIFDKTLNGSLILIFSEISKFLRFPFYFEHSLRPSTTTSSTSSTLFGVLILCIQRNKIH